MDNNNSNAYDDSRQNAPSPAPAQAEATHADASEPNAPQRDGNATAQRETGADPYAQNPPYGQNPYAGNPYGANGRGQNPYAQNPYAGNPYGADGRGQNPYAQNPYARNSYGANGYGQDPYTQNPPYGQNPYYGASPHYGQNRYAQPQAQPYTPPYGRTARPPFRPDASAANNLAFAQKLKIRDKIHTLSLAHGLALLGFSVFAVVLSGLLFMIPNFQNVFTENQLFSNALNMVYSIVIIFVPFALAALFLRKRGAMGDLPLGTAYHPKAAVLLVVIGVACCLLGNFATNILGSMFESIFGVTFTMPPDDTVIDSVPMFFLSVLGVAVVPALVEEFAIRGVVMQPLRKYGDKFAIIMSAVVFAIMHGNMVQIPFAFIAGLAIGYAVTATGTMWTGIAIHFLNNLVSVLMQTAADNLPENIASAAILGAEVVIFAAGGICAVLYCKRYARTVSLSKGETLLPTAEKNKAYLCTVPMILAILYFVAETARYVELA